MIRPRFKLPLWAALVIPALAYLVRSLVVRNGDFAPDMPQDLIVFGVLTGVIILVAWARRAYADDPESDE